MSCILRIDGIKFQVDDFLESTELKPYKIYRIGEKLKIGKRKFEDSNGCFFDLSKADFNDFEQQRKDALKFLKTHFDQLKTVFDFGLTKDDKPRIDFGITTRMNDVAVQCDYLEPELLKLAGNLNFGIEISQYHPATEDYESE
jgi:hypothetical protein|tara:strand:- start:180 stop:608 length:429 start_codon:yes stop_codon:yes gene_type:complete